VKVDAHISRVSAKVRDGALHRHDGGRYGGGRAFATAYGLGLPRTWRISTDSVLSGFEHGLAASPRRGGDRLKDAYAACRESLSARADALIERVVPDAAFVAVLLDAGQLYVTATGAVRVYLHRRGKPRRLTDRNEDPRGMLAGSPMTMNLALEPSDIVLLGSASAFSAKAIEKLASVLNADHDTPPTVIASLLTEPAAQAGAGAAAIVFRVR